MAFLRLLSSSAASKDGCYFDVWVLSPEKVADKLIEKHARVAVSSETDQDYSAAAGYIAWSVYLAFYALIVWFFGGRPLYRISATLARHEAASKGDAKG